MVNPDLVVGGTLATVGIIGAAGGSGIVACETIEMRHNYHAARKTERVFAALRSAIPLKRLITIPAYGAIAVAGSASFVLGMGIIRFAI